MGRGLYRHKEPLEQSQDHFSEDMPIVWDNRVLVARNEIEEKIRVYHVCYLSHGETGWNVKDIKRMNTAVVESRNSRVTRV